jgi:DNA invertase Pin-like site-specific DNA recombinase
MSATTNRHISYYRVSTDKQGESGLGLEAQQVDAGKLIVERDGVEIANYTDIETGKNSDRPELAKAIQHAKMANATLVVAKLDRLARNVAFTAALMDSGVNFICCDCKDANRFTLHILAAVAEEEARKIGERTKKALAAAKARGKKLGSKKPGRWLKKANGWAAAKDKAVVACQKKARKAYEIVLPSIKQLRDEGHTTDEIAAWLNAQGFLTTARKSFTRAAVWRILRRYFGDECARNIKSPSILRRAAV